MDLEPKDFTGWIGTAALAATGWLWTQLSSKATKDDLAAVLRRMDDHYNEMRDSRDEITEIGKAVARIEGQLGDGN